MLLEQENKPHLKDGVEDNINQYIHNIHSRFKTNIV